MATPREFERQLVKLGVTVAEGGDRVVRQAFLAIDNAVVTATPVDRGTARSNWLPNIDAPASGEIPAYAPGKGGSTAAANTQAALDAAKAQADLFNGANHRSLHLTNNLPYIGELNRGTSAQAGELFVERAVAAGASSIRGAKVLE